ncbi:MAG: hypothetical protein WAN05_15720 [Roseiarcus sp.]
MKRPPITVAKQIDTTVTTTRAIMGSAAFAAGVADVRTGRPVRFDNFEDDNLWGYERGRAFAYLAPMSMPLRRGSRLNFEALLLFSRALARGEIL